MKRILFTLLFLMAFITGYTQLYNSGGAITVQSGATLVIEGDYTSASNGDIDIDGTVELKGHFINNNPSVNAINSSSIGLLKFNGTLAQQIQGASTTFHCDVEIDNANGVSLTSADQVMAGDLVFTNGLLTLGNFDLTFNSVSGTTGSSNHVVTNGTGRLIGTVPTTGSLLFPVGYDGSNYAPVTLANADVADVFAVQVKDDLLDNCASGNPVTDDVVTMRWNIDPSAGSATEADITLTWPSGEEGNGFDNTDCSIIHCDAGEYTAVGGYGDGSSYSITGTGINTFSWFGVGDGTFGELLVDAKIFLQGPWNGTSMNTTLRTNNLVPTTRQPYFDAKYIGTHLEYAGTESNTSLPSNVVDWVLVELRTGTAASTSVGKTAALLLSDGTIAFYQNATGKVPFKSLTPGNYYVAIHHRNHFSVLSSGQISLTRGSASLYNFTTAQGQSYQDGSITTNAAMVDISGGGIYGMWRGDVNFDKSIKYNGASNDRNEILNLVGVSTPGAIISNTYAQEDVNLDGDVKYNGAANDRNEILNVIGVSSPGQIFTSHLPN